MTIFDFVVLFIFIISVLLSIVRGIVRESLSLEGWVIAYMAARIFAKDFVSVLPISITNESLHMVISFSAIFLFAVLVMSIVPKLASKLIRTAGLGSIDRTLGAFFGFVRGLLVVLLAGLTALLREQFWQKALLSNPLETGVIMVMPWLPRGLSERVNYGK